VFGGDRRTGQTEGPGDATTVVEVTTDSSAPAVASSATAPSPTTATPAAARYRCAACGNLTRFDVTTSRRTRAYHHYSVGGDLTIEDVEVLEESVEDVTCRWCGNGRAVEVLAAGDESGADGAT